MNTGIMVLSCDDQPDVLVALDLLLKDSGYRARMTASPKELLTELNRQPVDLILTDMNFDQDTTAGNEGLELIDSICRRPDRNQSQCVHVGDWGDSGGGLEQN